MTAAIWFLPLLMRCLPRLAKDRRARLARLRPMLQRSALTPSRAAG
jgi:hypothetical protein